MTCSTHSTVYGVHSIFYGHTNRFFTTRGVCHAIKKQRSAFVQKQNAPLITILFLFLWPGSVHTKYM